MFDLYLIGAGFSKQVGLPLGKEFFNLILDNAKSRHLVDGSNLYENILEPDIESFLDYVNATTKFKSLSISKEQIDFEEFISFLDIEHFLRLRGSDHWSNIGNGSQILIRNIIADILNYKLSLITNTKYELYKSFLKRLEPNDYIITFNYDNLIENCLNDLGKNYRLFPDRTNPDGSSLIGEEIVLLKMHGSIDWFDLSYFEDQIKVAQQYKDYYTPKHTIFSNPKIFQPTKIVDETYFGNSLNKIYKVKNLSEYFKKTDMVTESPLIVSPSFSKILYLNPLREFWNGFNNEGSSNKRVVIIGFSLSAHDEYLKQAVYRLIYNFQNYERRYYNKSRLKIVDFAENKKEIKDFKKRYSFVNWRRADCYFEGFNQKSIDMIFN